MEEPFCGTFLGKQKEKQKQEGKEKQKQKQTQKQKQKQQQNKSNEPAASSRAPEQARGGTSGEPWGNLGQPFPKDFLRKAWGNLGGTLSRLRAAEQPSSRAGEPWGNLGRIFLRIP